MLKKALYVIPWFLAGGLTFHALTLQEQSAELSDVRQRYQEQVALNAEQRDEFETRIQQLQDNLTSAQSQMANLSAALQEAREMMEPMAQEVIDRLSTEAADEPPGQ